MKRFHINNEGEPGECRALKGGCPFGAHFDTPAEARSAYEVAQQTFGANVFRKNASPQQPQAKTQAERMLIKADAFVLTGDNTSKVARLMIGIKTNPQKWLQTNALMDNDTTWAMESTAGGLSVNETKDLSALLRKESLLNKKLEKDIYGRIIAHTLNGRLESSKKDFQITRARLSSETGFNFRQPPTIGTKETSGYVEGSAYHSGVPLLSRVHDDGSVMHLTPDGSRVKEYTSSNQMSSYDFRDPIVQKAILFERNKESVLELYPKYLTLNTRNTRLNNFKDHEHTANLRSKIQVS